MAKRNARRVELGDWQTPLELARRVAELLRRHSCAPSAILEPTCGRGSFLVAASEAFPGTPLHGYEINPAHVAGAERALCGARCHLHAEDFFRVAWEEALGGLADPILVIGNPPWVTSADLGSLGSSNLPAKTNFKNLNGLDAITGKGNFDVSEWMMIRLLTALRGRDFTLCMLCKAAVARRILEFTASNGFIVSGATYRFDAMQYFDAAVDAVLLKVDSPPSSARAKVSMWPVFGSLDATEALFEMGVVGGHLVRDVPSFLRTRHLEGRADPEWRSGVKHDCARVMELDRQGGDLINGAGQVVHIEDTHVFPLVKGSDLANGRASSRRAVLVPQRFLGEDTSQIKQRAPKTWAYLTANKASLDARKSSIYRGQPRFAVFGIGDYSFAPYKVAICGLYKRLSFTLLGPAGGKPAMVDDTCYFLPFASREEAGEVYRALSSGLAKEFLEARIFWDAKRPINKAVLQALDVDALLAELGSRPSPRRTARPRQRSLGF